MKKAFTLFSFLNLLFAATLLFFFVENSTAQSDKPVKEDETNSQTLQGLTEAILVNGQPAFRIQFQNNVTSEVKLEKRDGEDALVFNVLKIITSVGKLYVTKTKITYVPSDDPDKFFKVEKSKLISVRFKDHWRLNSGLSNVNIEYAGDEKAFSLIFPSKGDKQALLSANKYLYLAITNFDEALKEFNQLTASVRQNEEEEEVEEAETEADLIDKYDRFKEITIVSTSKMLVRGSKRSIRAYAEYSFAGKVQKKPEKISLYFYASAARPLFREDSLELNFLVDEKRISLGGMKMAEEEKTKTATKQTIVVTVPFETFEQIAQGKKVEFQIGTLEYKLTEVHLDAFRKLLIYKIEE